MQECENIIEEKGKTSGVVVLRESQETEEVEVVRLEELSAQICMKSVFVKTFVDRTIS